MISLVRFENFVRPCFEIYLESFSPAKCQQRTRVSKITSKIVTGTIETLNIEWQYKIAKERSWTMHLYALN